LYREADLDSWAQSRITGPVRKARRLRARHATARQRAQGQGCRLDIRAAQPGRLAAAWRRLEPYFADCDPNTISPEMLLTLRRDISDSVSESEAHRVIKVWRAWWKKMATFGYCNRDRDPSLLSLPLPSHVFSVPLLAT
jgi:hypothetical protein